MDSAVTTSLEGAVRPWRRATLVASVVAALELLLLVGAGVTLLGRDVSKQVKTAAADHAAAPRHAKRRPAAAPPKAAPVPAARLARSDTSVLVLNGNGRAGAAASEAARVRARGYVVGGVGNAARSDIRRTTVMYRPGYRGEATRLARDLGVRIVGPLDGLRVDDLLGAHVALVVGLH